MGLKRFMLVVLLLQALGLEDSHVPTVWFLLYSYLDFKSGQFMAQNLSKCRKGRCFTHFLDPRDVEGSRCHGERISDLRLGSGLRTVETRFLAPSDLDTSRGINFRMQRRLSVHAANSSD